MTTTVKTAARILAVGVMWGLLLIGFQLAPVMPRIASANPASGPEKVIVGFYIQNIQKVDLATNSFSADFYVWLRWDNPDLDAPAGLEIMNLFESWALTETEIYEEPRKQPDGSLVWLARYQGQFNSPLSVADYPFQKQTLRFVLENAIENSEQVQYVPDSEPVTMNPDITLAGYNFGTPRAVFDTNTYPTSFGDVESSAADRTYTRAIVEIPVTAPAVSGISKTILPLLIVLIAAALGVIIPATYVDSKVNVPITALIALVAMQFGVSSALPEVGYLPMIDLIYVLAYAAITAMLAGAVVGAWVLRHEGEDRAMDLERRFTFWVSIGFIVSFVVVLLIYLVPSAG